jgi:hypothetical protein
MANGQLSVCAGLSLTRTTVMAGQFPGLVTTEVKVVL